MRAMRLLRPKSPLVLWEGLDPRPAKGEILLDVEASGVCRTDLHVLDGELEGPKLPLILGHEIVGRVQSCGPGVDLPIGARVGVPWLGATCGRCESCRAGAENLCAEARFTGYQLDGGYADRAIARAAYVIPLPSGDAAELAPLLCAGLIGFRALRMAGPGRRLGIYGLGAAGHIVLQIAQGEGREVFVFTRDDDTRARVFARELGASWTGGSSQDPPAALDAAILFAPVGGLVPRALAATRPGGVVVTAGIHMSDIPSFPYRLLWGERVLRSVANLTRADGAAFFAAIAKTPVKVEVRRYPLEQANQALEDLRGGRFDGAAVLVP